TGTGALRTRSRGRTAPRGSWRRPAARPRADSPPRPRDKRPGRCARRWSGRPWRPSGGGLPDQLVELLDDLPDPCSQLFVARPGGLAVGERALDAFESAFGTVDGGR